MSMHEFHFVAPRGAARRIERLFNRGGSFEKQAEELFRWNRDGEQLYSEDTSPTQWSIDNYPDAYYRELDVFTKRLALLVATFQEQE